MLKSSVFASFFVLVLAGSAAAQQDPSRPQLDPFRQGRVLNNGAYQPPWATPTPNRPSSDDWWRAQAAPRRNIAPEFPDNTPIAAPTQPTGSTAKGPTLPYLEVPQQPPVQWR